MPHRRIFICVFYIFIYINVMLLGWQIVGIHCFWRLSPSHVPNWNLCHCFPFTPAKLKLFSVTSVSISRITFCFVFFFSLPVCPLLSCFSLFSFFLSLPSFLCNASSLFQGTIVTLIYRFFFFDT